MPTLSFILSGLLVSSGAMYMYLSSTDKIEETKQKIHESNKVEYLSKKTILKLSASSNSDTNNSLGFASLDDSKISDMVAMDKDTNNNDMKKLDRLQRAVEKVVITDGIDHPNCTQLAATGYISKADCDEVTGKQFGFYSATASGLELPKDSILGKDDSYKSKLTTTSTSAKLVQRDISRYKKDIKSKNEIQKIISEVDDQSFITSVVSKTLQYAPKTTVNNNLFTTFKKRAESFTKQEQEQDETATTLSAYEEKESVAEVAVKEDIAELEKVMENATPEEVEELQSKIEELKDQASSLTGGMGW